jgi:uncharacterized protein (TIGR03084 family)
MLATVHIAATVPGAVADDYRSLLDDLVAEEADLDAVVAPLDDAGWATPTPAEGWDVRDSIAHLATAEDLAAAAATDPAAFQQQLEALMADLANAVDALVGKGRSMPGTDVLAWWRESRGTTLDGLRAHEPKDRLPWIAAPMSAMSFASARLMETWAHGQDIVDGLGITRAPTMRLRHVADIGVRTRRYAYTARGRELPDGDVRVELTAPDGSTWEWDESTTDTVRGPALDFCLVVTQRRNPADVELEVSGPLARAWIDIAQAFAGPATDHRAPAH